MRVQRRHAGDDLRRHWRQRHLLDHQRAGSGAPLAAQGPGSFEVLRSEHVHHTDCRGDVLAQDRHRRRDISADAVRRLSNRRADCRERRRYGVRVFRGSVAAVPPEIRDRPDRPLDELRAETARRRRQCFLRQLGRRRKLSLHGVERRACRTHGDGNATRSGQRAAHQTSRQQS